MGIKTFKPTPLSQRYKTVSDFEELTTSTPHKPLTEIKKRSGGRNAHGHITSRYRGGGHKKRLRLVDFRRLRRGDKAAVLTIEYDPNRTARIALIEYADKEKSYILAPDGLKVGMNVMSGPEADIQIGNCLPLGKIPPGTPVHNLELIPDQGARLVRSAGGVASILSREGDFANVKLPSGEVRKINVNCFATVGQCSNIDHENISIGKAGRKRWMGRSPHVRGVAMNPVDHPLGGGEGKTSGGRHPVSPWGQIAKGLKTRRRSKPSNRYIVKDRRK